MEEKRRKEAEDRGEDPEGAPDAAGQAKEPAAGDGEAGPGAGGGDDEKE